MSQRRGFTLLELLIVITIIGILAAVVLVATNEARQKSQYTKIVQQLHEVENALWLYASYHKDDAAWGGAWPSWTNSPPAWMSQMGGLMHLDNIVAGSYSGSPSAVSLASSFFPGFNQYLAAAPDTPMTSGFYAYHSKNNPVPSTGCYPNQSSLVSLGPGVSIRIGPGTALPYDIFLELDRIIDNNDGPICGKIMYETTNQNLFYVIANQNAL